MSDTTGRLSGGEPSHTALRAARHRWVHQILEEGRIYKDPVASKILGGTTENTLQDSDKTEYDKRVRNFIALRHRVADDFVNNVFFNNPSTRQLVILGAGLDTFSYRNSLGENLRIFEVDHPATQQWKLRQLEKAGIVVPSNVTFVGVDFEKDNLGDCLTRAGFSSEKRSFFTLLGVVYYLTKEAFLSTASYVASLPGGSAIVFDYAFSHFTSTKFGAILSQQVARAKEPFKCFFDTKQLHEELSALGFKSIYEVDVAAILKSANLSAGILVTSTYEHQFNFFSSL